MKKFHIAIWCGREGERDAIAKEFSVECSTPDEATALAWLAISKLKNVTRFLIR